MEDNLSQKSDENDIEDNIFHKSQKEDELSDTDNLRQPVNDMIEIEDMDINYDQK